MLKSDDRNRAGIMSDIAKYLLSPDLLGSVTFLFVPDCYSVEDLQNGLNYIRVERNHVSTLTERTAEVDSPHRGTLSHLSQRVPGSVV